MTKPVRIAAIVSVFIWLPSPLFYESDYVTPFTFERLHLGRICCSNISFERSRIKSINDNIAAFKINESEKFYSLDQLWPPNSEEVDPESYIRRQLTCEEGRYVLNDDKTGVSCTAHGSIERISSEVASLYKKRSYSIYLWYLSGNIVIFFILPFCVIFLLMKRIVKPTSHQ